MRKQFQWMMFTVGRLMKITDIVKRMVIIWSRIDNMLMILDMTEREIG